MTTESRDTKRQYDPNRLLDTLKEILNLDSDLALAQILELPPPVIGQIRHRGYPMAPSILIRMHEVSKLSIWELREITGDRRKKVRTSYDASSAQFTGHEKDVTDVQGNVLRRLFYFMLLMMFGYIVFDIIF